MDSIIYTMLSTPLWVWGVLAYLLFIGMKATKSRILHPLRLFVTPNIFMVFNYNFIIAGDYLCYYIICSIMGLLIGFIISMKTSIVIFNDLKRIKIPGNNYTIILLVSFFFVTWSM